MVMKICGYTEKQISEKIQKIVDKINSTGFDECDDIYRFINYYFRKADYNLIEKIYNNVSYKLGFTSEENNIF